MFGGAKMLREQVFNSIDVAIVVVDVATKRIVDLNTAAIDMIGSSEEDVLGSPSDRYLCDSCETGTINNKKYELLSVRNVTLDGRDLVVKSFMDITNQEECEGTCDEDWSKLEKALSDNIDRLRNGA